MKAPLRPRVHSSSSFVLAVLICHSSLSWLTASAILYTYEEIRSNCASRPHSHTFCSEYPEYPQPECSRVHDHADSPPDFCGQSLFTVNRTNENTYSIVLLGRVGPSGWVQMDFTPEFGKNPSAYVKCHNLRGVPEISVLILDYYGHQMALQNKVIEPGDPSRDKEWLICPFTLSVTSEVNLTGRQYANVWTSGAEVTGKHVNAFSFKSTATGFWEDLAAPTAS